MRRITPLTLNKVYSVQPMSRELAELLGYELIEELFVDSSGFGADDEPALTKPRFEKRVAGLLAKHGMLYACATGVGMFQLYVGLFKRNASLKKAKRIAPNTYEITDGDVRKIRLYETNIITLGRGKITFNNGGYATRTTHKRMNQFAPAGFHVCRKNWETYVNGQKTVNGRITLPL